MTNFVLLFPPSRDSTPRTSLKQARVSAASIHALTMAVWRRYILAPTVVKGTYHGPAASLPNKTIPHLRHARRVAAVITSYSIHYTKLYDITNEYIGFCNFINYSFSYIWSTNFTICTFVVYKLYSIQRFC